MSKLIIISGLPASGKSSKAKELSQEINCVRINKDLLREMLHFGKYSQMNEEWVRDATRKLISWFLSTGMNVISDDTNLNPDTFQNLEDLAKLHNAKLEHIKMNTPMLVCIERDKDRAERGLPHVGEQAIRRMAMQYGDYLKGERVIICDILSTVAQPVLGSDGLQSRPDVIKKIDEYRTSNKVKVIFITTRQESQRGFIEAWLRDNVNIPYEMLLMNSEEGTGRADTFIKAEMYDKYLKRTNVVCVFDNIDSSWRAKLLPVIDLTY